MLEIIISNIVPISTAIVAVLTTLGGGIAWLKNDMRKTKAELEKAATSIASREQKYSEVLEKRIDMKDKDLQRISQELIELRIAQAGKNVNPEEILKEVVKADNLGIMWVNKRSAERVWTMVGVSKMYAATFLGGPQELYEGRTDHEIFDEETANGFIDNNEKVYKDQEGIRVEETVKSKYTGVMGVFKGRKFPIRLPNGNDYIMGVGEWYEE
tara:strand:- start:31 stop:669 length:639 start_codon:yes stop_codon:yes gene_type:complete